LAALLLRLTRRHFYATLTTVATAATFLVAAHIGLERFEPYLSSRAVALRLQQEAQPGDKVMIYGDQAFGSSLLFYYGPPISLVNGRSTSMLFGSTFPDAPKIFLDDAGLAQAWKGSERVFVFAPADKLANVKAVIGEAEPMMTLGEKVVFRNRP
jgi:hypothetical protein